MGKLGMFLFAVCILVGLYFLNSAFNILTLPDSFSVIDVPIKIIGGILIIIGGVFMIKLGKKKDEYSSQ